MWQPWENLVNQALKQITQLTEIDGCNFIKKFTCKCAVAHPKYHSRSFVLLYIWSRLWNKANQSKAIRSITYLRFFYQTSWRHSDTVLNVNNISQSDYIFNRIRCMKRRCLNVTVNELYLSSLIINIINDSKWNDWKWSWQNVAAIIFKRKTVEFIIASPMRKYENFHK